MSYGVPYLSPTTGCGYDFSTPESPYEDWMSNRIRPWDGETTPDVGLVGIPFDGAILSWPGARFAPNEIRKTFQWQQTYNPEFDVDVSNLDIVDMGDIEVTNTDVLTTWNRVEECLTSIRTLGITPLGLGGDHSLEYPSVKALCNVTDGNVGLIRIDAHEDFCHSGTGAGAGDQESSGVPVRKIVEMESGQVRPENIAMLGQHGWTHSRYYWEECKQLGMYMSTTLDIRREGIDRVVDRALDQACSNVEAVYFTVDIDCLDHAFAPGTSAPTTAGMDPIDLIMAIHRIASNPLVKGFDVMEVSPPIDTGRSLTSLTAGTMVMHMLGGLAVQRRGGATK